jgi:hypothetical protein
MTHRDIAREGMTAASLADRSALSDRMAPGRGGAVNDRYDRQGDGDKPAPVQAQEA